jgi:hypothetical protein
VTAFVNVNGREPVLNPGPLSRRPDKSSIAPRSATRFISTQDKEALILVFNFMFYLRGGTSQSNYFNKVRTNEIYNEIF